MSHSEFMLPSEEELEEEMNSGNFQTSNGDWSDVPDIDSLLEERKSILTEEEVNRLFNG